MEQRLRLRPLPDVRWRWWRGKEKKWTHDDLSAAETRETKRQEESFLHCFSQWIGLLASS